MIDAEAIKAAREKQKQRSQEVRQIALEVTEIFKSHHLNYLESENVISEVTGILKNHSYLET